MQVTDFEMICPISRGAYGRVYKVKKKSTGEELVRSLAAAAAAAAA
jgi:hypothetical protein